MLDRLFPVFFLLVKLHQSVQRAGGMFCLFTLPDNIVVERFSAVEQTRFHVVFGQFQDGTLALRWGQVLALSEVVMDMDGAINLATTAKQVA